MNPPKLIELKPADVEALLERGEKEALQEGDYEIIKGLIEAFVDLSQAVDDKATALKRLLRIIFGAKTETRAKLFEIAGKSEDVSAQDVLKEESEPKNQPGHGRNGADAYKKAERIKISIQDLKAGEPCRECPKGRLYPVKKAGTLVRFVGMAPLAAKIYELEKLRCNLCGEVFTAQPPNNVGSEKYDETAGAMIATLKYGSGGPFYRIEKLQESMGMPLPASTQWDIVENAANKGSHYAYRELIRQAAQGNVIHNDDTPMKILELVKEINEKSSRTGMFTTGMKAIAYMLKHWDPLTLFLRVPGAPLDNNICEQTLKKAILHRKNSLFYKTEHGAFIGDMFMSLIHTCNLGDINPFDYLVALQKHFSAVFKNPGAWMPWNYQASLPVNDS